MFVFGILPLASHYSDLWFHAMLSVASFPNVKYFSRCCFHANGNHLLVCAFETFCFNFRFCSACCNRKGIPKIYFFLSVSQWNFLSFCCTWSIMKKHTTAIKFIQLSSFWTREAIDLIICRTEQFHPSINVKAYETWKQFKLYGKCLISGNFQNCLHLH